MCTLILNKRLYVAWVGDSTAMLVKRDSVVQLVSPHRLHREVSIYVFTMFNILFAEHDRIILCVHILDYVFLLVLYICLERAPQDLH